VDVPESGRGGLPLAFRTFQRLAPLYRRLLAPQKKTRNLNDLCIQLLRRKLTKEGKKCRFPELRFVALA
jgi:hypothetical protein